MSLSLLREYYHHQQHRMFASSSLPYSIELHVKIDIPDNAGVSLDAEWQEIDICVDGTPMKMKVLGTAPY
jgi:hypothetical protein